MAAPIDLLQEGAPPALLWLVPGLSVVAGSLLGLLPLLAPVPVLPPFGLLVLLGWRLLKPDLLAAWMALPVGLADDLIGGAPLGSAMTVWTLVLLGLDIVDHRLLWRDRLTDWWLALAALLFAALATWAIARFTGGAGPLWTIAAPTLAAALCFPLAARLCALLDRVRLRVAGLR